MRIVTLTLTTLLFAGCLSDKVGTIGETTVDDTATTTDTGVADTATTTDTAVTDTVADSDVQDTRVDPCKIIDFDFATHVAPTAVSPYEYSASVFVVSDDRLLADTDGYDAETGERLQAVIGYEHGSEPVVLTENEAGYHLQDALGSRVLVSKAEAAGTVFPAAQSLYLIDDAGERLIMGGLRLVGSRFAEFSSDMGRRLADEVVTWLDCLPVEDGHDCQTTRVMVAFRNDPPVAIATITREGNGFAGILGPDVVDRAVVWAEREDVNVPWRITHREAGSTRVVATIPSAVVDVGSPRIVADRLFWNTAEGVFAVEASGPPATPVAIADASCRMVDTDARGRVLLLCNDDGTRPNDYFTAGTTLKLIDTLGEISTLATGKMLVSAHLSEEFVVWLSYPTANAGCNDFAAGEVHAVALDTPDNVKVLAPIGVGCLCCGAYWPSPQVSVGGRMVAWNYPNPGPEPRFPERQGIGYAVLTADVACP